MIVDVGDQLQISTAPVPAGSSTPVDATVTLVVTKPDATIVSPTIAHPGTGSYTAVVSVDQAGEWTYLWTWAGAAVGVDPGQFNAIAPRVLVSSFGEVKRHLNRVDTLDDDELRTHLHSATDYVEWRIGGPVSVQTFTEDQQIMNRWITPTKRPLVSVASVTSEFGGALDPSTYTIDKTRDAIRLRWAGVIQWQNPLGWYTIVYQAGLSAIAERFKLAGEIVAAHLWQTQNGGGGLPYPGDDTVWVPQMGFAVPRRAEELLGAGDSLPGFA